MTDKPQLDERTRRRIRITAAILGAVALLIYIGFIVEQMY